jgi:S1-C subfamily serine protease
MEGSQRFNQLKRWLWTCRGVTSHYGEEKNKRGVGQDIENFVDHFREKGLSSLDTSNSKTVLGMAFLWSDAGTLISWLPWYEGVRDIECSNGILPWIPAAVKGSDRALDLVVLHADLPADANFRKENRWLVRSEPMALGESLNIISTSSPGLPDLVKVYIQPSRTNLHTGVDENLILFLPPPPLISSAGVLVDEKWRVAGYLLSNSTATWGAAIQIPTLDELISMINRKGKVTRPYVGFKVRQSAPEGFMISQVEVGGPAHLSGLRVQDRILKWDKVDLKSSPDWKELRSEDIGKAISVTYQRGSKTIETQITPTAAE